ncbi:hypothetical protein [Sphingobacterium athyrii]|uniref:Uncharacterized protein n=1 Tax=Sphingobacterium athyrii TaxID=2152717 RepID=A0A363NUA6_9SPHI|nr:hypothetical protein [Sphingobacterium athyrii]PUV24396.1 hypothetical protein DCO56_13710 [Sphingobacterium athyrii]
MKEIKEIIVKNYPVENTPIIRIFDENFSYLLIDNWPLEDDERFSDDEVDKFEAILSDLLNVKVKQEDRDRFVIFTNDEHILEKLLHFLESK